MNTNIDLELVQHIGIKAAETLQDNADRWNELYDYLEVVRVAQTTGWKLQPSPSKMTLTTLEPR